MNGSADIPDRARIRTSMNQKKDTHMLMEDSSRHTTLASRKPSMRLQTRIGFAGRIPENQEWLSLIVTFGPYLSNSSISSSS